MAMVMTGVDPHRGSHTANGPRRAGQVPREAASAHFCQPRERLLAWAKARPGLPGDRRAAGRSCLFARLLAAAGEQGVDVQPELARPGASAG